MIPQAWRHGLPVGVDARCSCRRCRRCAELMRDVYADTHMGVPGFRATRRVHALVAIGWTLPEIAYAAGVPLEAVQVWAVRSDHAKPVRRVMFARLAAAYEPMSGRPLLGCVRDTIRAHARTRKLYGPLAWVDIDDKLCRARSAPHAEVDDTGEVHTPSRRGGIRGRCDPGVIDRVLSGERVDKTTPEERREVCRRWVASGRSLNDLERLTGWRTYRYYRISQEQAS